MSIGPTGFFASVAALPPSLPTTSDTDRTAHETTAQAGRVSSDMKAESAAGIGKTDGDEHATAERDADGRRLFEKTPAAKASVAASADLPTGPASQSKDPTGDSGGALDLTG